MDEEEGIAVKDWEDLEVSVNEVRAQKYTQADIDAAVLAEREACAKACENHHDGLNMLGGAFVACATAIRERSREPLINAPR